MEVQSPRKSHRRALGVIAAAAALVMGIGGVVASASPSTALAQTALEILTSDTLAPAPCPVDIPAEYADRVSCAILTVPERRVEGADPERTIDLPIAVIESTARNPSNIPLIFPTAGGPGAGSFSSIWLFLGNADWATLDRDVVIIEQRGDAASDPSLDCTELGADAFIDDGRWLSATAGSTAYTSGLTSCRDRLLADGVDLSAYTSAESAADLADLRTALGYTRWNIYGASYGARLALTVMRDRPDGLEAVILDGAYPPQIDLIEAEPAGFVGAVDALIAACASDDDCDERYPRISRDLERLMDAAADDPLSTTVLSPVDGAPVIVEVDDRDLARGLFNALYSAETVRVLPFVIDRLLEGDLGPLLPLTQQNIDSTGWFTEGLALSIACAEEHPFANPDEIEAAYALSPLAERLRPAVTAAEECAIWGVPPLAAVEAAAVSSGVPTLLLVGGYDPITPLPFSEAAATGLSVHYLYEFPTLGHGVLWDTARAGCPASIARAFLSDPFTEPDASCISGMRDTDFLTATDIRSTSAIYRLNAEVIQSRSPAQTIFAIAAIIVLVGTLIYAAVYAGLRSVQRTQKAAPGTMLAATTTAGAHVAFIAGLFWLVSTTDQMILGFGVPPGSWPLFLLPFVALALGVLLVGVLVLAWLRNDGSLLHRVVLSISAVTAIAFSIWLLYRGLIVL
ncbi:alpha/beta hydrolase [Microbacterium lacus]|uniref:alpha/beta hydrolase n=1 Tax=Microbacterium lacus TaxID=415217 RepID=UPI003850235F